MSTIAEVAIERANLEVWTAGRDPQRRGMGATFSNELTGPEIHAVLASSATPAEACTRVIAAANDHGGKDDITVIVAARDACWPPEG